MKKLFVKGAWLYTLKKELSEEEFIKKVGSKQLEKFRSNCSYPYVSLVLDNPDSPILIGHPNGRVIALTMKGYKLWQTMEWKHN